MESISFCIYGAGGFSLEVIETIAAIYERNAEVRVFVDPEYNPNNSPSLFDSKELRENHDLKNIVIAIGDGKIRFKIAEHFNSNRFFPILQHPTSIIGSNCNIGIGAVLQHHSIITTHCTLGKFAQVNLQVSVGHNCEIGDYFTAAPKCSISGNVHIGDMVTLGTGSTILPGLEICSHVSIGAGAVVTKDIKEPGIYVGIPAKRLV
jgi:sugar O-acyltransferase (sialic acid O-acetyltransferase NeuD family)